MLRIIISVVYDLTIVAVSIAGSLALGICFDIYKIPWIAGTSKQIASFLGLTTL